MNDYIIDNETGEVIEKHQVVKVNPNELISEELIDIIEDYYMAKQRYDDAIKDNEEELKKIVIAYGEETTSKKSKNLLTKFYKFQYTYPTTRESFDVKKFQEDYPDVYKKYLKEVEVKDSLKVSERKY